MSRAKKIILLFYFAGIILLSVWVPWRFVIQRGSTAVEGDIFDQVVDVVHAPIWKPPSKDRAWVVPLIQWEIFGMELIALTALCGFCLVLASSLRLPSKKELASLLLPGKRFLFNSVSDTPTQGKGSVYYLGEFTRIFFTFLVACSIFACAYSALVGKWVDAMWSLTVGAVIMWLLWIKKLPGAG